MQKYLIIGQKSITILIYFFTYVKHKEKENRLAVDQSESNVLHKQKKD